MKHIRFTLNDFCLNTVGQKFTVFFKETNIGKKKKMRDDNKGVAKR